MSTRADVEAIVPFTNALHELGIEYFIGGSVASSVSPDLLERAWRQTKQLLGENSDADDERMHQERQ